jgi:hypothetical protein
VRDGGLGAAKGAITLKAGEGEGVLEVFEFGGRDENGGRHAAVSQGDVLVLGGSASQFSELAPRLSDGIRSRHASSVHLHIT